MHGTGTIEPAPTALLDRSLNGSSEKKADLKQQKSDENLCLIAFLFMGLAWLGAGKIKKGRSRRFLLSRAIKPGKVGRVEG
jgi:hypothetical protein